MVYHCLGAGGRRGGGMWNAVMDSRVEHRISTDDSMSFGF